MWCGVGVWRWGWGCDAGSIMIEGGATSRIRLPSIPSSPVLGCRRSIHRPRPSFILFVLSLSPLLFSSRLSFNFTFCTLSFQLYIRAPSTQAQRGTGFVRTGCYSSFSSSLLFSFSSLLCFPVFFPLQRVSLVFSPPFVRGTGLALA